jgi:hypothetical protein
LAKFLKHALQAKQIAAARPAEKNISIYTNEGDKVALSFDSEKSVY